MRKPPAFQFYVDNFVEGVADFDDQEVGLYTRLLCAQWNRGGLPNNDDDLLRFSRGSTTLQLNRVKTKFKIYPDGMLRNERLEHERRKQLEWRLKSSEGGKKSSKIRKGGSTTLQPPYQPPTQPKVNSPSPTPSTPKPQDGGIKTDAEFESAKKTIGELFGRSADQSWAYGEEHALSEIIRREGFALELCEVVGFKKRILDGDIRFEWPKTLSRLLNDWTGTLDKARNYSPTQNAKPATGADRNKGTFNEGKSNLYA